MIDIKFNEDELKALYLEEVQKRLDKIELQSLLMDSKQLCRMLSLSWPTVEKMFLRDPNFPSIRIGSKWLFNRREVERYINLWSIEIKKKSKGA
ncbi:helix-turn-helix domain-containing protein [Neobacillus sp. PS3-40]|uniref:helix-turn-helix domain-containing protein n=1 Tax=Neobacillus sp. PS3-40 TaxID=3070679 RepID=UPI0027DFB6A8|nr:helix-turn-helix domain-containing protein [Neobacillus sp. PS3-40]WML46445.1 helix-turn-helix domain-containing protein [Neobacillus sp. PS3-40]